ncbi:MAG: ECF transporter S component [Oscillospiraceae bacterium]|jgi:uncharacterized membrane protein|nr:ECF transporter S component [Oscillospiraceae bacterium]
MGELKRTAGNTRLLAMVGVLGALCFVSNYLSIPLPAVAGTPTRIHLGNVMCLLSGMLIGPVPGGVAAGVGSMLYDFTNPAYIADSYFTLIFKFLMGFVCGKIARAGKADAKNRRRSILAAALGQLTYIALYLSKSFLTTRYFDRMELETVVAAVIQKAIASTLNGIIAVIVVVPLALALRKGLEHAGLLRGA